ncbi:MAG: hypothetical protein Q4F06_09700 [Eubacteriales bacterium]|nr:hypothetical protein [Eubacteriales bacterium]
MDYNKLEGLKEELRTYEEVFNSGDFSKAQEMLSHTLEVVEEEITQRKAGEIDNDLNVLISRGEGEIYISLNHVMEYYLYACYFEPEEKVNILEIPIGSYYRTYGDLCLKLEKYKTAEDAYKKSLCYNPVDLDSYLGLAECYKHLNMLGRFLDVTKQAYRYCCTRATMARYYRNMGFYYLSKYNTDMARACYLYSNIYYHTENADSELEYLKSALSDETPDYSISDMQQMFDKEGVEPGPDSKTIGIIYRVAELMMEDKEYVLARDCYSIVYDITREPQFEPLLKELDMVVENGGDNV